MNRSRESVDITHMLQRWSEGEPEALDELLPLVYPRLHAIAANLFRKESEGHILQATALVNEVYLQLVKGKRHPFDNRERFFLYAGSIMRRLLIGYARERNAVKRGGDVLKLALDESLMLESKPRLETHNLLALDEALEKLARIDRRQCRIVEMRFFAGLSNVEIGRALNLSTKTIERDWRSARVWLCRELKHAPDAK